MVVLHLVVCWALPASAQLALSQTSWTGAVQLTFAGETLLVSDRSAQRSALRYREVRDTLFVRQVDEKDRCGGREEAFAISYRHSGEELSLRLVRDDCTGRRPMFPTADPFSFVATEQSARRDWAHRDPIKDSIVGINLEGAYGLLKGRPYRQVIVAVIDNGFDVDHEDLRKIIWTNAREIPGNGIDDDHNGYADDVHGWNFRSARDGTIAENDQMEATRIYARWKGRYEGVDASQLDDANRRRLRLYLDAKRDYLAAVKPGADTPDLRYAYNPDFQSSTVIGDNPDDPYERSYGSPFMRLTPSLTHGTHVAGIIAAQRDNGIGTDGIADHVLLMPIVATTAAGDERDKDVANAIRYAVDNGARVINMSFSKRYSPDKTAVDDAVRYAAAKNVLLVHAAGNDGENDDSLPHYPIAYYEDGTKAENFLSVGWSRSRFDARLAHPYSDYGARSVDVFAPGSDIFSTVPGGRYDYKSASSMSTAVVTGVAAMLMVYFPDLSAVQVKEIIMRSSFKPDVIVNKPGTKEKVSFRSLSVSGGVVNAYNAVSAALGLTPDR